MQHFCSQTAKLGCWAQWFCTGNSNPPCIGEGLCYTPSETRLNTKEDVRPYTLDSVLFPSCSSRHVSEFVSDTTHALGLQNAMKSKLAVLVEIN